MFSHYAGKATSQDIYKYVLGNPGPVAVHSGTGGDWEGRWAPSDAVTGKPEWIAFRKQLKQTVNIYVMRPDGSGLTLLIQNAYQPTWGP